MRDSEGTMHNMTRGHEYDVPAEIAYGVGSAVDIIEAPQPTPANIPETKDIPEPPRHKMIKKPGKRKGNYPLTAGKI